MLRAAEIPTGSPATDQWMEPRTSWEFCQHQTKMIAPLIQLAELTALVGFDLRCWRTGNNGTRPADSKFGGPGQLEAGKQYDVTVTVPSGFEHGIS